MRSIRISIFGVGTCVVAALLGSGPAARAHPDSPASPPLVPSELKLLHTDATWIVALFSQPQLPATPDRIPRAARVDEVGSLVPYGAEAVLRTRDPHELTLVGTEAVSTLRDCIRVLDVAIQPLSPQRARLVVAPRRGKLPALRVAVLHLPGAGSAEVRGGQLTLEGSPDWLFRAERQIIRGELGLPLGK